MLLAVIAQIFGTDIDLSPEVITTVAGAITALLVFVVPNLDEKGENAARQVDRAITKLKNYVNSLPQHTPPS